MLRSMTAYGRAAKETSLGRFTAEIQSVNRKHLEINVFLPKELSRFDVDVKKWISAAVGRGQISVKFTAVFNDNIPLAVSANIPLALKIQEAAGELSAALDLPSSHELTLKMLAEQPDILLFDELMVDEDLYRDILKDVFDAALKGFLTMKTQEGHAIFIDISQKLGVLHQEIKHIALHAPNATKRYRQRLTERLQEFTSGTVESEERLLRELGIFAERIDISEEVTLFEAHLKQFSEVISIKNESVAKTLEFLIQEMNRETNTIGSKSSDLDVSRRVVEMKSILERIREIIQNVE
jgi:uncharacterized protein (TIGR00255 family)